MSDICSNIEINSNFSLILGNIIMMYPGVCFLGSKQQEKRKQLPTVEFP